MNIFDKINEITNVRLLKYYRQRLVNGNLKIDEFADMLSINNADEKEFVVFNVVLPSNKEKLHKVLNFMKPSKVSRTNNFDRIQSYEGKNYWEPMYKIANQVGTEYEIKVEKPVNTSIKVMHLQKNESMPKSA